MALATNDVENVSEERLLIANTMIVRTGRRLNLSHHMIDNVILEAIDEHIEKHELIINETQEEYNKNPEILKEVKGDFTKVAKGI